MGAVPVVPAQVVVAAAVPVPRLEQKEESLRRIEAALGGCSTSGISSTHPLTYISKAQPSIRLVSDNSNNHPLHVLP